MHVLVVGGTRFVGYLLTWRLLARGDRVTLFNRGRLADPFGDRVDRLHGDRTTADFARLVGGRTFDAAVDFAAYTDRDTQSAVEVLAGRVGHYVFVSTGQVYLVRQDCPRPSREADYDGPLVPEPADAHDRDEWAYGVDKRAAEDALAVAWATRRFPATRLRLPMVNGERDHFRRIESYLWRVLDGGPVILPDGGTRTLKHVYGADVAALIAGILGNAATHGRVYNLAQDDAPTVAELVGRLAALTGAPPRTVAVSTAALRAAGLPPHEISPFDDPWMSSLDATAAKAELGFRPESTSTYLPKIVAAFLAAPPPTPPDNYRYRPAETGPRCPTRRRPPRALTGAATRAYSRANPTSTCRRRPHMSRRLLTSLALLAALTWLLAPPADAQRKGGALRVAMIGEPPSLDPHMTTATITREIGINWFETLFTFDAKYQVVPLLAESSEALDGAKRYVIRLRKGVRFHNGKELTAADVVASLKRWGAVSTAGKATFKTLEAVEAKDAATVEIRLKEPAAGLLTILASLGNAAAIYPKEVIDAAGDGPIKDYIGTGPFKFVEHRPDRHVKLVRYDGYASPPGPANGLGGQRVAHVDELYFLPVPDYAIRTAGIQTGEYQYAQQIKPDQYERLKALPGVEPVVIKPFGWTTQVLNAKQGLFTDKKLRQAFQATLDAEPMMLAAMGHPDFFRLDPGLYFQEQAVHSRAGEKLYNQRDKDKARRLLKEAGYQGQPVRWIVTTEYEHHYKPALVAKTQLEEVGFKIDLQVMDWATVVQRRNKPELWDVFSTAVVFEPDSAAYSIVLCEWPGWWCNPEKEQLLQAIARELDAKKRYAMWERVQTLFYEDAARMRIADYFRLDVRRKEVQGFRPGPYMHFWNVSLEKS